MSWRAGHSHSEWEQVLANNLLLLSLLLTTVGTDAPGYVSAVLSAPVSQAVFILFSAVTDAPEA